MIYFVMLKFFEPIQIFQTPFSSNRHICIYLFNSSTEVEESTAHGSHSGSHTSVWTISNKLAAHSILAYEQSSSHLSFRKVCKRQTIKNQMTPKFQRYGVPSSISF